MHWWQDPVEAALLNCQPVKMCPLSPCSPLPSNPDFDSDSGGEEGRREGREEGERGGRKEGGRGGRKEGGRGGREEGGRGGGEEGRNIMMPNAALSAGGLPINPGVLRCNITSKSPPAQTTPMPSSAQIPGTPQKLVGVITIHFL
jgi:hypothetical protein